MPFILFFHSVAIHSCDDTLYFYRSPFSLLLTFALFRSLAFICIELDFVLCILEFRCNIFASWVIYFQNVSFRLLYFCRIHCHIASIHRIYCESISFRKVHDKKCSSLLFRMTELNLLDEFIGNVDCICRDINSVKWKVLKMKWHLWGFQWKNNSKQLLITRTTTLLAM